ncbi:MAG: glycosyltransferase family 4 protein [Pleurocapsa sp.]
MKIAVIGVKGLPASQGGIEHYSEELYSRMIQHGHSVDLYARSNYTNKPGFSVYKYKGIRIVSLPSVSILGLDTFLNCFIATIMATFKGYDIVHIHALGPALFCGITRLLSSAKIIVTCHGLDWQRAKWNRLASNIIRLGEKSAVRYAHDIIVVSQYLQTYFYKTYGLKTNYIPTAPAKYEATATSLSYSESLGLATGRYILFLGRLVPEKRPDLLIKAFESLDLAGWKLVLVGELNSTNDFKLKLNHISANNQNIIFTQALEGSRLSEIVRGAGLFLMPSDLEGLPLAMLEAMREGIPVLASDIPPHQQLIGKDRGLLFEAGNLESLRKQLNKAILNPEQLIPMAQKAQKHVERNYNWQKILTKNLELYGDEKS